MQPLIDFLASGPGAALNKDFLKWVEWRKARYAGISRTDQFLKVLQDSTEFRSIADYRVIRADRIDLRQFLLPNMPRVNDLYIGAMPIGGGFRVQHGYSTYVLAEIIGEDFLVGQNVTIGVARGGAPRIGDNVWVRTGAVVVGPITIGDNVEIYANAVVSEDVPANSKVYAPRCLIIPQKPTLTDPAKPARG